MPVMDPAVGDPPPRKDPSGGGVAGHVDQRVNLRAQRIRSGRTTDGGNRCAELTGEEFAHRRELSSAGRHGDLPCP